MARFYKSYPPIPDLTLKENAHPTAYTLRVSLGPYIYDQPELEATLGPCEDRPLHTYADGDVYLG